MHEEGREHPDNGGAGQGAADDMAQAGFTIWQETTKAEERDQETAISERGDQAGRADNRQGQAEHIRPGLDDFRELIKRKLGLGVSFDVVMREMTFGGRRTALVYLNGFGKDTILTDVLMRLTYLDPSQVSASAVHDFLNCYIPAISVKKETEADKMCDAILTGASAFYLEGEDAVLIIDAKSYPSRTPEEPTLERVVRGSRDGFVETLMTNITLVRRRLRDPSLRYKMLQVGRRTKTDVCIAYLDDLTDKSIVEDICKRIEPLDVDGLPMAEKQLLEVMADKGWNPFPLVRYSERPDVVASHLMDGSVAVFVDTSPSVMLLPTTFFDLIQHAEENRQTPGVGTYLRWVRFFGIIASVYLLPLWFLYVLKPELLPPGLSFIGPTESGRIPILLQFLLAELGIDLMRMAAVHTPSPLATAMSLVSAILIGDIAVTTGLFINEVILYVAVAAIGMFATPSYELALANRIVRLVFLVVVAMFQEVGFIITATVLLIALVRERSFDRPYLWPFIPFDFKALMGVLFRQPFGTSRMRPNMLATQDSDRYSKGGADAKNANDK